MKVKIGDLEASSNRNNFRFVLPNAFTIVALCFGLTSLTYADDGAFERAIACILIAAVLDACDGRVARALGTASKFGAELDSLADVVCFGAAPAYLMYKWGMNHFGAFGWLLCLSLTAACALRLARFNVGTGNSEAASWTKHFFVGVPAPAGAFLALLPVYVENSNLLSTDYSQMLALFSIPITAGLMISRWPSFSAKAVSRKALRLLFVPSLISAILIILGLIFMPWLVLALCAIIYLGSLPFSKMRFDSYQTRGE